MEPTQPPIQQPIPAPVPDPVVAEVNTMQAKRGRGWMIVAILLAVALVGMSVFGYFKWQEYREKTGQMGARIAALESQVDALETANKTLTEQVNAKPASSLTSDEQVIAAAKTNCEAEVNPDTKKAKIFTLGTVGTANKKVVYANNNTFAEISATCTNSAGQTENNSLYVLKKMGNGWIVVDKGTQVDSEKARLYGIPTTFQ